LATSKLCISLAIRKKTGGVQEDTPPNLVRLR
jgi:hypothetical protein